MNAPATRTRNGWNDAVRRDLERMLLRLGWERATLAIGVDRATLYRMLRRGRVPNQATVDAILAALILTGFGRDCRKGNKR